MSERSTSTRAPGRPGAAILDHLLRDRHLLARRQIEADRVIAAEGAGHLAHAEPAGGGARASRPWRLDPIPLVIDGATFDVLAAGVTRRAAALETLLADLYGPRTTVRAGVVPAEALASSRRYRTSAVGTPLPNRWLTSYAADVVRLDGGSWRLVQDLTDAPTGIGFALIDRSVMARVAVDVLGPGGTGDVASLSGFQAELRHALTTVSRVESPRVVLFTGGVGHPAYVEHSFLAKRLGFHLVEGPDLVVRQRRLWLRTLGGLDPIDVVYRRVDDDVVDPIEIGATGKLGVPGLLFAAAERGVVLANAHGSGVVEDPDLAPFWPDALAALDADGGIEPLGSGELAAESVFREGQLVSAPVVVRLHAVAGPDGVRVMAGGNGRVLAPGDDPRRPSALTAKDVWVLGSDRVAPIVLGPHLPQVDLAGSVPTRAAVALFWAGRAAERAEAIARTVRVVAAKQEQDPALSAYDDGRWARRMHLVLRSVRGASTDGGQGGRGVRAPDARDGDRLASELSAATVAVGERLEALLADAATVGQFLSSETGRVLGRIAGLRDGFADGVAPIDALDTAVTELAAFAGLWHESTVRGPAWHFGDIGRRIERALVVAELVDACVHGPAGTDVVEAASLEVLLAANESLVAYRRNHRSDIELGAALDLVVADPDNPRAFVAAVRRIREHCDAVGWADGAAAVDSALAALDASVPDADGAEEADARRAALAAARRRIGAFATQVIDTWFATPVNPVVVRGRVR